MERASSAGTYASDELAQQGLVNICSIEGLEWCEIDTRFDLVHAEETVPAWRKGGGGKAKDTATAAS